MLVIGGTKRLLVDGVEKERSEAETIVAKAHISHAFRAPHILKMKYLAYCSL